MKRISELIAAQDIGDSDLFVIEQGGAAKKAAGSVVKGAIGGSSLPSGGTPGQVLTKTATGTEWDDVSGLPDGGNNGQVLTKTNSGAEWSDAGTPTQAQTNTAVTAWLGEHPEATTTVQDGSITEQKLDPYLTAKVNGGGISNAVKVALLAILEKVAYTDDQGQTYLDALETALYPPADLLSISAVFNQGSAAIYDTDSLDTLKQYLTVTAHMSDGTSNTVTTYTLSGTLAEGTSTIVVAYGGKTTTFTVTVSEDPDTSPIITEYGVSFNKDGTTSARDNWAITDFYSMNYPGSLPYTLVVDFGGYNTGANLITYDSNKDYANQYVCSSRVREFAWKTAEPPAFFRTSVYDIRKAAYAYVKETGVVIFADVNSQYYGMRNISEASS